MKLTVVTTLTSTIDLNTAKMKHDVEIFTEDEGVTVEIALSTGLGAARSAVLELEAQLENLRG